MPEDIRELLPFLAYATLFVGVILAVEGLRRVADSNETTREAKNRRMCMLAEGSSREEVFELLKDSGVLDAGQNSRSYPSPLRILKQAGVRFGAAKLFIFSTIFGGLIFIAASNLFSVPISAAVAVIIALGFPWMLLVQSRKKRIENLGNQLPDALALMARGLRVGHPLNVTVQRVAQDMPDPIGTEFGIIEDQVAYGEDLISAFAHFADRTGLQDIRYLAVSVGIQHSTGGDLARVLDVLAKVVRDRTTMRKKISAISAEGRISAYILSILPFGIFGLIHITTPTFYGDVWDDPLFLPAMAAVLVLVATQAFILFRLVNFRF